MAPANATRSSRRVAVAPVKVASRVSKAKKAPKAKTPKAKAPPVVEVADSQSASPAESRGSPPPIAAPIDLQGLITQLSDLQAQKDRHQRREGRVHKSRDRHHRRHHRHRSDSSDTSDSESDEEERRGVPFQYSEGKKPFRNMAEMFRSVEVKYFKQIFFGTFRTKNFPKLARLHTNHAADEKDIASHNHLMHCFTVYAVAVVRFAAIGLKEALSEALQLYTIRILQLPIHFRFDSIRDYHLSFVTARIQGGQDVAKDWLSEDQGCYNLLVRKGTPADGYKPNSGRTGPNKPAVAGNGGICRNFNRGVCSRERCIYQHICSNCQQNHPADKCTKPQNSAGSGSNQVPLTNRISKTE